MTGMSKKISTSLEQLSYYTLVRWSRPLCHKSLNARCFVAFFTRLPVGLIRIKINHFFSMLCTCTLNVCYLVLSFNTEYRNTVIFFCVYTLIFGSDPEVFIALLVENYSKLYFSDIRNEIKKWKKFRPVPIFFSRWREIRIFFFYLKGMSSCNSRMVKLKCVVITNKLY